MCFPSRWQMRISRWSVPRNLVDALGRKLQARLCPYQATLSWCKLVRNLRHARNRFLWHRLQPARCGLRHGQYCAGNAGSHRRLGRTHMWRRIQVPYWRLSHGRPMAERPNQRRRIRRICQQHQGRAASQRLSGPNRCLSCLRPTDLSAQTRQLQGLAWTQVDPASQLRPQYRQRPSQERQDR